MKLDVAQKIVDYVVYEGLAGEDEIRLHEGYSGRGMYGERTTGIATEFRSALSIIGYAAGKLDISPDDLPARSDTLGRGDVWY